MKVHCLGWIAVLGLLLALTPFSSGQQDELRQQLDAAFKKGVAFYSNAQYAESIPHFEKVLTLAPKVFGAEHPNTAGIMNTLGAAYLKSRNSDKALPLFKECLRIREMLKDSNAVAASLNNLAHLYEELGQY